MSTRPYKEKCIGSACPKKSTCKLYLINGHQAQSIIRPPYKMDGGKFIGCEKYEESYADKVLKSISNNPIN